MRLTEERGLLRQYCYLIDTRNWIVITQDGFVLQLSLIEELLQGRSLETQ
jgi:hypothetical protein